MSGRKSSITVGYRVGRLEVIEQLPRDEYDERDVRRTLFLCKCDCGNTKIIDAGNLRKATKSCGCLQKENARKQGKRQRTTKGYLNNYWGEYRRTARNRKREFNLPFETFVDFVSSDCYYCGSPPELRLKKNITGIAVPVNGIDRVDANGGYVIENCVTCCETCNRMKLDHTEEKFMDQCFKIVGKYLDKEFKNGTQLEHADIALKIMTEDTILKHFPFLCEVWDMI